MDVRRATASDLEAVVAIVESQRRQYQKYQPTFWHKAADSAATTGTFFGTLLGEPQTCFLVATESGQILGVLIARPFQAPPVYAPGGDTYLIDDFAVVDPRHWLAVGEALLSRCPALTVTVRRASCSGMPPVSGPPKHLPAPPMRSE